MPYDKAFQEALQSYYESHDFTGRIPAFDAGKYTPAQTAIYLKAKTVFSQAWLKLLPDIGNKRSMKNFSPDYPLNCLCKGARERKADRARGLQPIGEGKPRQNQF